MIQLWLATCRECPKGNEGLRQLAAAARGKGWSVLLQPWQDLSPASARAANAIILPLATWDYSDAPHEYQHWLAALEREKVTVFNSPALQCWNLDKQYLSQWRSAQHAVSECLFLSPDDPDHWQTTLRQCPWPNPVIKPRIGQSGKAVRRLAEGAPQPAEYPFGAVIQPFQPSLYEICFIFLNGQFSHAIKRHPAKGEWRMNARYGAWIKDFPAAAEQYDVAAIGRDLWEIPEIAIENPLYARADALLQADGRLIFNEIELIEPALYFDICPAAAEKLLWGIERHLEAQSAANCGNT